MKHFLRLAALVLATVSSLTAQQATRFFTPVSPDQVNLGENTRRDRFPAKFDTYRLDYPAIKAALASAPWEFTNSPVKCIVTIPVSNGELEDFSIVEVAQLDDEARAAFPDIHCYAGVSEKDPRRTVRLSTTVRGFRAMIMRPDFTTAFVEPYAWGQTAYYLAYDIKDTPDNGLRKLRTEVATDGSVTFGEGQELYTPPAEYRGVEVDPVKLKVYRTAIACTGEFGQDHGTTKQEVFSAMTEYMNMISAVYERDITLRLQLTAGSQNAVFIDPASDPYSGSTVQDWLEQNQDVLNFYCNINSFDIGHVLARYISGGAIGVGQLEVVCTANKGGGCSAGNGAGDYGPFFLAVLGQELGHQMSCGHTWNNCGDNGQRDPSMSFEPGSGSTIMSYAGACGSDNVQGDPDLYFHAGSINKIKTYYTFGAVCGSYSQTTNNPPVVTLPYKNGFFIPISTPFELNGTATDADGDQLTYCWEEVDLGPPAPINAPAGNCPIFRTRPAVNVSNRVFPRLQTILVNGFDKTEQLPTYSRELTFRLTARDNKPNGGGVTWADVEFNATNVAGPFKVSYPNANTVVWHVGEYQEVTWDVANTYELPVFCRKVNIRLSIDGGQTYPITLASGVENDGSQYVLVPDNVSSSVRVRIDAADNVFFDVSNANFRIQQATQPALTLGLSNSGETVCLPAYFSTDIVTAALLGYSDPIQLELTGDLPPGASSSFSATTIQPGQSANFTVDLTQVQVEGIFTFNIHATSGAQEFIRPITLVVRRNDFTGFELTLPANGLTGAGLTQTLHWNTGLDADSYDVELSTSPTFSTLVASRYGSALDSFKVNVLLQKGVAYYWRVRPINECGTHDWSEPFFFSTFPEDCRLFESNDLPKNLSASNVNTLETKVTVNLGGQISDVNIKQIDGYHEFFKDLEAHLINPTGTDVMLWKDKCGNFNGSFNFGLDDAAPGGFPCPPNNSGNFYRPVNPMTAFNGGVSTGTWTFRLKDNVIGSGGSLDAFKIEFCASITVTPPFLVNNVVMPLPSGTTRTITPDFLRVDDPDNNHSELKFTMITEPEHGTVDKSGTVLHTGDQFTQADIDAGNLHFTDNGVSAAPDGFRFIVNDGKGGFYGAPKFVAQPLVGAHEPGTASLDFVLFPNPAESMVQVAFGQPMENDATVTMFDLAGRALGHWNLAAGASNLSIEVNQVPKGIYLVAVNSANASGVRKLIVH